MKLPAALALGAAIAAAPACAPRIDVEPYFGHLYSVTQEKGEADLHAAARSRRLEDARIYFNGRWLDIGFDEKRYKTRNILEYVLAYLTLAPQPDIKELFVYHIHPAGEDVYPPSDRDILFQATARRRFGAIGIRFASRMFDGYGMWEYDVDAALEQALNEESDAGADSAAKLQAAMLLSHTLALEGGAPRSEKIRDYIESMKEFGVLLSYRPLE